MYNKSYKGLNRRNKGYKAKKTTFNRGLYRVSRSSGYSEGLSLNTLRALRALTAVLIAATVIIAAVLCRESLSEAYEEASSAYKNSENYGAGQDEKDAALIRLVNKNNPLEEDFVPELEEVDGAEVNSAAAQSLRKLLSDAEKDGVSLKVSSAYISYAEQEKLYKSKYKAYKTKLNLTNVKAQAKTEATVPQAGDSDAQTGLLVKFSTAEKGDFKSTEAYAWLDSKCIDYGFILRYPSGKTDRTSMKADYTAFRYVGRENAVHMRSLDKCMEEYAEYQG